MSDFLANDNICGQNLLRLVSRGNAIIAELMRLKEYVPPIFKLDSKRHVQKYGSIIMDFAYFKAANTHEQKIENDTSLQELDEDLRENYADVLSRFYIAFESIHKYVTDFNAYIDELEDGNYIQQSVESVILNEEGRQLMCEAVYLYGVMLLLVDHQFEGQIRERILVSYYRYNAQRSSSTRVDDVCMLLRSTGFSKLPLKRPLNYPEDFFRRVPIKSTIIDLLIGRLRSDEIYSQSLAYPNPEHRSIASANQAAMLVIILSFQPTILNTASAIMREIVDHFFPDNWVISIYMGIVLNLYDWWSPYKAARTALNNTLETTNVKKIALMYGIKIKKLITEAEKLRLAVTLDENEIESVVKLIRECNISLHWILLHTTIPTLLHEESKRARTLRQQVINESKYTTEDCLELLLSTAQIEHDVKQMYKQMLEDKESKWLEYKNTCVERINDLIGIFDNTKNNNSDSTETNDRLKCWFKEISAHINSLHQEDGKKIAQLLQALEEVQEFHQLEKNLQVSQYLNDTREILYNMLRIGSISENTMIALNILTDCCYAWNIMETFISIIQTSIKKNPPMVIKLKALFLKMASALEMPLLRVNQARSADLSSVSQYYSRELESYARRVLQIIPETVFGLLAQIVNLETNVFKEIPTKLNKDMLKDYAQLDERLQMAKLTYAVSVFTKGVLSLRSVSLGVLRVDSNRLLEDGIRQELVKKVTLALHNGLTFDNKSKVTLVDKLNDLAVVMDGYRKAFQYIQDYININSLKIWHEELTYIINLALEDECKHSGWMPGKSWKTLVYEEKDSHKEESNGGTFMGRLARELIRVTEPKITLYIEHALAWYDLKTQNEVLNHKVFSMILTAMGTPGLFGLDKLLTHLIGVELKNLHKFTEDMGHDKGWASTIDECMVIVQNSELCKSNPAKLYYTVSSNSHKIWPYLVDCLLKIGHYQLLRNKICYELNTACKFEAKHMEAALQTFNTAILSELSKKKFDDRSMSTEECDFIHELSVRLDWTGISDPLNKIYIKLSPINNLDFILFLFTIFYLHKVHFCKNTASLLSKKIQDPIDAVVFTIGIQTLLRQFSTNIFDNYLSYLCKYVLFFVSADNGKLGSEWESEGTTILQYIQLISKFANIPKSTIFENIPVIVLDQYKKIIK